MRNSSARITYPRKRNSGAALSGGRGGASVVVVGCAAAVARAASTWAAVVTAAAARRRRPWPWSWQRRPSLGAGEGGACAALGLSAGDRSRLRSACRAYVPALRPCISASWRAPAWAASSLGRPGRWRACRRPWPALRRSQCPWPLRVRAGPFRPGTATTPCSAVAAARDPGERVAGGPPLLENPTRTRCEGGFRPCAGRV